MIHEEQHLDINGIAIMHVRQRYQMRQVIHIHQQHKQSQQQKYIHIRQKMRMEHGQVVRKRQRHGRMWHQQQTQ